jgi:hypothetical protein
MDDVSQNISTTNYSFINSHCPRYREVLTQALDWRAGLCLSSMRRGAVQLSFRSNRHCPKCQNDKAQEWLEAQQDLLLPIPYFMLTFNLPAALCEVVY